MSEAEFRLGDLVRIDVVCPVPSSEIEIPNEWLEHSIRGLRRNLELAVRLGEEVDDMHPFLLCPIETDDRPGISKHRRTSGLSGAVVRFAALFDRLIKLDIRKAKQEFLTWPTDDNTVFSRLRFWASGKSELATPHAFGKVMNELTNEVFWDSYHQRDLLLVLAKRWAQLPAKSRMQIERRLLEGPTRLRGEEDTAFKEYKAWAVLGRLQWLFDNKCEFSFDVEKEIAERRPAVPKWKPEYAKQVVDSWEIRSGWVGTNSEHSALLHEPIGSVLSKARSLSGRTEGNALEERDPFTGLCTERPKLAYLALLHAARRDDHPEWAWTRFLDSDARKQDAPKFSAAIAERLCRFPNDVLIKFLFSLTSWFQKVGTPLSKDYPASFDKAVSRLADVLREEPSKSRSAICGAGTDRDWVMEAINSPVGHLAEAILEDSRLEDINTRSNFVPACLIQLEKLLALPRDARRYTIAIISQYLNWFHHLDQDWTERHLLSVLDADDDDRDALWAGFLWNPQFSNDEFYLRLKPGLLALAKGNDDSREGHLQSLAGLTLSGWIRTEVGHRKYLVSNSELRDVLLHGGDELRSHMLWHIGREINDQEAHTREEWIELSVEFFRDVWPREKVVKSPTMSARLCELLLTNQETFAALIDIVLPFLTTIKQDVGIHFHLSNEASDIIEKSPESLLKLLHAVLADTAVDWPYGTGDVLNKIGEVDKRLLTDPRLIDLKRKWNNR